MTDVDVAVIGRGMIGASAGRHLAEGQGSVALIGPGEAPDRRTSQGPFQSHCDSGRITRIAGRTAAWSTIGARSIARYRDVEQRSGIDFYHPRAMVAAFSTADEWIANGAPNGSDAHMVDRDWVFDTTGVDLTNGLPVLYESAPAGWIDPRRFVAAQTELTAQAGGTVIDHVARRMRRVEGGLEIAGDWGSITAGRVLVSTGAFGSALLDQVEPGMTLDVERRPRSVLLAEMADDARIPSLLVEAPPDDRLHEIYWVPPTVYPDGRRYLKIGGNLVSHPLLAEDELVEWFHTDGDLTERDALEHSLRSLLPKADFISMRQTPCVITGTPTGHPYIGWVADGVAVAIAGNGSAAKSADELGRLGSTLFAPDGWTDSLDAALFAPQLA